MGTAPDRDYNEKEWFTQHVPASIYSEIADLLGLVIVGAVLASFAFGALLMVTA